MAWQAGTWAYKMTDCGTQYTQLTRSYGLPHAGLPVSRQSTGSGKLTAALNTALPTLVRFASSSKRKSLDEALEIGRCL